VGFLNLITYQSYKETTRIKYSASNITRKLDKTQKLYKQNSYP